MLVYATQCELGEGVLWHPTEERLYWVDIEKGRVYRDGEVIREGPAVGGFTFQQDGSLLLFGAAGRISRWAGEETVLLEGLDGVSRFNDVIAAPDGSVYAGTMDGRLYHVSEAGVECLYHDHEQPNGMAFVDGVLHMIDTHKATLFRYPEGRREAVFSTAGEPGFADGLTVDREGHFWSARWAGSCLIRYRPDGSVASVVAVPAENVTSCCFAGEDLWVSTATGGIHRLQPGFTGFPENLSRVYALSR